MKEALLLPLCPPDFHHLPASATSVIGARCSEVAVICSDWSSLPRQAVHLAQASFQVEALGSTFVLDLSLNK